MDQPPGKSQSNVPFKALKSPQKRVQECAQPRVSYANAQRQRPTPPPRQHHDSITYVRRKTSCCPYFCPRPGARNLGALRIPPPRHKACFCHKDSAVKPNSSSRGQKLPLTWRPHRWDVGERCIVGDARPSPRRKPEQCSWHVHTRRTIRDDAAPCVSCTCRGHLDAQKYILTPPQEAIVG